MFWYIELNLLYDITAGTVKFANKINRYPIYIFNFEIHIIQ